MLRKRAEFGYHRPGSSFRDEGHFDDEKVTRSQGLNVSVFLSPDEAPRWLLAEDPAR